MLLLTSTGTPARMALRTISSGTRPLVYSTHSASGSPALIFFHDDYYSSSTASHCGIYVGNDQFVHASTYGSGGVLLTALNGNPYYSAHYIAARRMG